MLTRSTSIPAGLTRFETGHEYDVAVEKGVAGSDRAGHAVMSRDRRSVRARADRLARRRPRRPALSTLVHAAEIDRAARRDRIAVWIDDRPAGFRIDDRPGGVDDDQRVDAVDRH